MQAEDESVSYASKMSIADGRLTWTEAAEQILARFRGVTPEPGAWCELGENRFKIGGLVVADERLVQSLTEANGGPWHPARCACTRRRCWSAPELTLCSCCKFSPPVKDDGCARVARGAGKDMAEGLVVPRMSNEKRPHKGGHGKPGHSGKPGNGKFNQGSGQGEGGAKRKRRRRSGAGNGSGSGVSEQNRQQSQKFPARPEPARPEPAIPGPPTEMG